MSIFLWDIFGSKYLFFPQRRVGSDDDVFPQDKSPFQKPGDFELYDRLYLDYYLTLYNSSEPENKLFEDINDLMIPERQFKTEKLYLWFLYMNRPQMAKYLCSKSRVSLTFSTFFIFLSLSA